MRQRLERREISRLRGRGGCHGSFGNKGLRPGTGSGPVPGRGPQRMKGLPSGRALPPVPAAEALKNR